MFVTTRLSHDTNVVLPSKRIRPSRDRKATRIEWGRCILDGHEGDEIPDTCVDDKQEKNDIQGGRRQDTPAASLSAEQKPGNQDDHRQGEVVNACRAFRDLVLEILKRDQEGVEQGIVEHDPVLTLEKVVPGRSA